MLHPFLEKYKSYVADLRWIQVLFEYKVPDDYIAIKSFLVQIEAYRSIISLNIVKTQYQTSYIISNETETDATDIYYERFIQKDVDQELLPFPDGFRDVISSVESGDTIQILMSRTRNSKYKEISSYIKNVKVEMSFFIRQDKEEIISKKVSSEIKSIMFKDKAKAKTVPIDENNKEKMFVPGGLEGELAT